MVEVHVNQNPDRADRTVNQPPHENSGESRWPVSSPERPFVFARQVAATNQFSAEERARGLAHLIPDETHLLADYPKVKNTTGAPLSEACFTGAQFRDMFNEMVVPPGFQQDYSLRFRHSQLHSLKRVR